MSRQFKNGRCSCWTKVNKHLEQFDTELALVYSMTEHVYLEVGTERNDGKRQPPKRMVATCCPFCGAKLKELEGEQ